MKKLSLAAALFVLSCRQALANPACIVCTVAVGASLSVARTLGVQDDVVGIWLGAILALLGYWAILWFDRKGWRFTGRDTLLMLSSLAMAGGVYVKEMVYTPKVVAGIFYVDPFLFAVAAGALIYVWSQKFYAFLKAKNGGHAHFPFEKVVLPLALLGAASVYVSHWPL